MKKMLCTALLAAVATLGLGIGASANTDLTYPSENVNVGDVIVASVKTHAVLNGEGSVYAFTNYNQYADYAVKKGIIGANEFSSHTVPATKLDASAILSRILPDNMYGKINSVYNISDIPSDNEYYSEALKMYRAGIVVGDEEKNFQPDDSFTVSELGNTLKRLVFPERRVKVKDEAIRDEKQAYLLNYSDSMDGPKEGIESGWEIDNRAGSMKTALSGNATLIDMMDDESSRLIRHFNLITEDKIDARFRVRFSNNFDGNRMEFCDANGNAVYRLVCKNGAFNIENADGSLTEIYRPTTLSQKFLFRVIVDLETGMSTTEIDNIPCGEFPLNGNKIKYFAFSTGREQKNVMTIIDSYMYSNYAVYENLNCYSDVPFGFESNGVSEEDSYFSMNAGSFLTKKFDPVSGNVAFCFNAYLPEGSGGGEFALYSDGKKIISFDTVGGDLYAGGKLVKQDFSDKLWHKMRIEADTNTNKAIIKINAKVLATVDFEAPAEHFDEIKFKNNGTTEIKIDDIRVYNLVDYDVPEPVIPEGDNDYIIGLNICSLWINGEHYGWGCVTPYEDIKPVLGYYDEGIPESADWENKFMAEHGIDFQAFCWYANQENAPMKDTRLAAQLDEAYLHSKYSDDVQFCLLWEAANASKPKDSAAFRNYFVPYWIENYFSDPRYMKIDNKLVFSIFGVDKLIDIFGTALKDEFDYMRNEVKKLGFDGMIITASHTGKNSLAAYGIDAWQAYNWGKNGYKLSENTSRNTSTAKSKDVYVIPTVSVGFNDISWAGVRYPLMTVEDFKSAHEWVRDTYLPTYALKDDKSWNDKLLWLSTWNEYGEGTYIMPSDKLNGFGYLDALREVYTKGGTHTDHVPTAAQKENFNHIYPQDRRILRAYGNYVEANEVTEKFIDLTQSGVFDKNFKKGNMQSYISTSSNGTTLKTLDSGSADAIIYFTGTAMSGFKADDINHIEVVASGIPEGSTMQMFFTTSKSPDVSEANSVKSAASAGTHEQTFILNLAEHPGFSGSITTLRLDPLQKNGVTFTIKSMKIVPHETTVGLYINDRKIDFAIKPEYNASKDLWLMPFEPGKTLINFMLYVYHEWDYDTKVLKLYRDDKCVEFTAGKDVAKINGTDYSLSAPVYLVDNIPMIAFKDIAEIFGFACEFKDGAFYYTTPEKYIFDAYTDKEGQWNFDLFGILTGWQADNVTIDYGDGTIIIISGDGDPRMRTPLNGNLGIDTSKYSKIEVRCRWNNYGGKGVMGFYFTTDTSTSESQSKFVGLSIVQKTDEFVTLTFDMASNSNWTGTLKSLRYDIFDSSGYCEVDYIRLIK